MSMGVALNFDPFDFLERQFLTGAIIEFGRAWRFVVSNSLSVLQRSAVLQVRGNPGGPKRMAAGGVGEGSRAVCTIRISFLEHSLV
jgi:hypothetical protein